MLESISSKAVTAVAVLALLGTVIGYFQAQNGALEEEHFRAMCYSVARAVDGLSSLNGGASLNITFRAEGAGLHLDPSFRGKAYQVEFRASQIIFRQGELVAAKGFIRPVHLWDPNAAADGAAITSDILLERLDSEHNVLRTVSGNELSMERVPLLVSGLKVYHTFVTLSTT
jgi:hypothetical protein